MCYREGSSGDKASSAMAACAYAPPARISAATQIASMICSALAPFACASLVCPRMQYGHCVVCATATAINCFVTSGNAPSAKTWALKAVNASCVAGASFLRRSLIAAVATG